MLWQYYCVETAVTVTKLQLYVIIHHYVAAATWHHVHPRQQECPARLCKSGFNRRASMYRPIPAPYHNKWCTVHIFI